MSAYPKFDFTVIGSGPGGYVSAIRAAQLGLKSVVIERSEIGGICLNWGCIPTKTLLESAHLLQTLNKQDLGIELNGAATANLEKIVDRSRQVASRLSKGIEGLLKKYKVTLIRGSAKFQNTNTVEVLDEEEKKIIISSEKFCIATGARPREFSHLKFSQRVVSYKKAMILKEKYNRWLIIGAGAIGCEFADFFQNTGSQVTLVELADHILPLEEADLAKELKSGLEKKGIKVWQKSEVKELKDDGKKVSALINKNGNDINEDFDCVLLAIGIVANTEELGLKNLGIDTTKGFISINENCQVNGLKNIYAIGDVVGGKQLAHKASREGMIAGEHAAGKNPQPLDPSMIPSCTYTSPQVASIGYNKKELEEKKITFITGTFPFSALGRALAAGENRGFAKIYIEKNTGELLGAHLVGHEVTELISNVAVARASEITVQDFLQSVFPHPTLSECIHEAIGQALGESPNI